MVTRKPIPASASQRSPNALPYPVTPTGSNWPDEHSRIGTILPAKENNGTDLKYLHGGQGIAESSSSYPPANDKEWLEGSDNKGGFVNQKQPWSGADDRIFNAGQARQENLPASLRVHQPELTPRSSSESQRSQRTRTYTWSEVPKETNSYSSPSTNPYHRTRNSESSQPEVVQSTEDSSSDVWAELASHPPPPMSAPPPPPNSQEGDTWQRQFNHLSVSNYATQPSQDAMTTKENGGDSPLISLEAVASESLEGISRVRSADSIKFPIQNAPPIEYRSAAVQIDRSGPVPNDESLGKKQTLNFQRNSVSKEIPVMPTQYGQDIPPDRYNEDSELAPPELPPRRSYNEVEISPPQPPRPPPTHGPGLAPPRLDTDLAKKQRGETYQIKHITWADSRSTTPRTSPIMVQNANGPCPLLALVNALTLLTPANVSTALIETLRLREQVSLGLLLDAVFDELMSGRRGDTAHQLPDVGELYSFLITLHTGMNVNPRFASRSLQQSDLIDAEDSDPLTTTNSTRRPGDFEETREMKLYGTFSVPLIHGWLPPRNHPAYIALQRSAPTYEDAQNLMFREEELEDKLQREGLDQDEQLLLEDIASIKYFLSSSATQLTGYGLDTITEALTPGSIVILFRNDHFSTLYRHPRSGQLLTLVTDMGYAGHDEVVWESLVDVRGEGCEFFAGDFRPVGNTSGDTQRVANPAAADSGWQTVSYSGRGSVNQGAKRRETQSQGASDLANPQRLPTPPTDPSYDPPTSPNTEQEDHDLALAMQLQEEEDDRSRREAEARRREDDLSRAYLESQGPTIRSGSTNTDRNQVNRPLVPPRGGSNAASRGGRNIAPRAAAPTRRDPEAGEDAPPPSYEQAAKSLPYNPPAGQPYPVPSAAETNAISGGRPQVTRPRQVSAYSQQASLVGNIPPTYGRRESNPRNSLRGGSSYGADGVPGVVRRRSAGVTPGSFEENDEGRNKDCIIM